LFADRFTGYRVVFLLETFLLLAALLYLEPLVRLWGVMRPYVYAVFPHVAPYFPHVAVLGIVLSGVGQFYKPDTGFTSLIMFGEQFEPSASAYLQRTPHAVDRGSGYDGQFYAQIALDPLLRSVRRFVLRRPDRRQCLGDESAIDRRCWPAAEHRECGWSDQTAWEL
jgi:hypothetical protein